MSRCNNNITIQLACPVPTCTPPFPHRFAHRWPLSPPLLVYPYDTLALVYCDPEEDPVVWDYRARRFLRKHTSDCRSGAIALVFVCHWRQAHEVDLVLRAFANAHTLPIDRCCTIWFDSPEVQQIVQRFSGTVRVVDQPVSMVDIIRSRGRYPHHNSCRC